MAIRIRSADLDSDEVELKELIRRHLAPQSGEKRFHWLYRAGPYGPARAWLACDDTSGVVVGAAAAFPRKMYFDGIEQTGFVLGDFCLDQRYRSLGPALQLQRACLEEIAAFPGGVCYDLPSQTMMAVYRRLGINQTGSLIRWAKPLRIEHRIEAVVRSKAVAKPIGIVASWVLAQRGWKGKNRSFEFLLHEGPCGEEFDALNERLRSQLGISTVRTAEYLNWRYLAHPQIRYEILKAWRAGELIGYAVFNQDLEYGTVADLCSSQEPTLNAHLLDAVVELLRRRHVTTVNMQAGDAHPWSTVFRRCGFRAREASPVIVYTSRPPAAPGRCANWYLMQGERES
jgi:hypothetical protein